MTKWWLKLYTIPQLKTLLMMNGFCIAVDAFCAFFGVRNMELISFIYIFPVLVLWVSDLQMGMARNIEFHKSTMAFPELVKALVSHYSLMFTCALIIFFAMGALSEAVGGSAKSLLFLPLPSTILAGFFLFCFFAAGGLIFSKPFLKITLLKFKAHYLVRVLISLVMLPVFFAFFFVLDTMVGVSSDVLMFLSMISMMIGVTLYCWRAIFHKEPEQARKKHFFKYNLIGFTTGCGLFFLCALAGMNDHLNLTNTPEERVYSLMTWRPVSGQIDVNTFLELEPHVSVLDYESFYKLSPQVGHLPIERFIDTKRPYRLSYFLVYGKPSLSNLNFMVDHLERHKVAWRKLDPGNRTINLVANAWPKNTRVPDILVQAKVQREVRAKAQASRAIASEK